jgi:hypothetical protein
MAAEAFGPHNWGIEDWTLDDLVPQRELMLAGFSPCSLVRVSECTSFTRFTVQSKVNHSLNGRQETRRRSTRGNTGRKDQEGKGDD